MFGLKGHKEPKGELEKPKCEPKKPKCERDFEEAYRSIRSEWSKTTTNLCQKKLEKDGSTPFWRKKSLESLFSNVSIALYRKSRR